MEMSYYGRLVTVHHMAVVTSWVPWTKAFKWYQCQTWRIVIIVKFVFTETTCTWRSCKQHDWFSYRTHTKRYMGTLANNSHEFTSWKTMQLNSSITLEFVQQLISNRKPYGLMHKIQYNSPGSRFNGGAITRQYQQIDAIAFAFGSDYSAVQRNFRLRF